MWKVNAPSELKKRTQKMGSGTCSLFLILGGRKRLRAILLKLKVNSCTFADFIALRKATGTIRPADMSYHCREHFALGDSEE